MDFWIKNKVLDENKLLSKTLNKHFSINVINPYIA